MFQDIKKIIGKKNTNILKIFLFMNILMFFLETISILSIPLFVSSIVDTEVIINKINNLGFINFSELDKFSLIKFISILVISIFFLKNLTFIKESL